MLLCLLFCIGAYLIDMNSYHTRNAPPPKMTVAEDPDYAPFFRMLKVGVPMQAVQNKVAMAGLDASLLKTPNAPSPNA